MAQEHKLENTSIVSILESIDKQFPKDGPSRFIAVYLGVGVIISFLFLASLAPQLGEKFGTLSVQKKSQESRAYVINDPSIDDFYSTKTYVNWNQSFTLNWKTSFAGSCRASGGWDGNKIANGSQSFVAGPGMTTSFTLTCFGNSGQSVSKTILVNNPNTQPPSGQGGIAPGPCNPYGDVNASGYINSDDAGRVLQIVAKIGPAPTGSERRRSDVDGDGQVTSADALKILRLVSGLDNNTFPVCTKPF